MKHLSLHQKIGRIISLRTFAILALFCPVPSWAVTYNFEGLSPGNLVGQDNWTLAGGGSSRIECLVPNQISTVRGSPLVRPVVVR